MALLSEADRRAINHTIQQVLSDNFVSISLTKAEIRAAVDAVDEWIDNNAASFNQALPTVARNTLTARQKVQLFMFVVSKRFEMEV